jgi:acetoin utilization deacetylase AcuC-like enzyme
MPRSEPTVVLLTDPAMAEHASPGHPERPERLEAVVAGVIAAAESSRAHLERPAIVPASDSRLAAVHEAGYLAWLVETAGQGGGWIDPDTYVAAGSWNAARLAAGAAIQGALAVARGEATVAFAAGRPPGHHAHHDLGKGFCLLNNVVVAASALRDEAALTRIAILDWDVHHGDGTQAMVEDDPDVFYASTHQYPWYPGTGAAGEGTATVLNVPLDMGSGDPEFIGAWTNLILSAAEAFAPQAILVSAGFDAHRDDPLAGLGVTADGFGTVAREIGAVAGRLGLPGVTVILEGGYDLEALRTSAAAMVKGLLIGLAGSRREAAGA